LKPICFTEEMLLFGWSPGPVYHEYFCRVIAKVNFTDPLW